MRALLLVAALYAPISFGATETTCFSDAIDGIPFKYCTQNSASYDHTRVLWYLHSKNELPNTFADSPQYAAIKATWRQTLGLKPPVFIAVSFGVKWTLSDLPSTQVAGSPVLYNLFVTRVMGYVERKVGAASPLKRWGMGFSMGGYNASLIWMRNPGVFKKVVLGCPGFFTIDKFSDEATRQAYVDRNAGAIREMVDNGVNLLGADDPTIEDWTRNNPLELARTRVTATSAPVYIWYNLGDQFGLGEGAKQMIDTAKAATAWVASYSNTGTHCMMDSTIDMHIANFLR